MDEHELMILLEAAGAKRERSMSFSEACARYVHRFTLEHIPACARHMNGNNLMYNAPQYASDKEWYDRTFFHGEHELATARHCYSTCPTWPLGKWLAAPYRMPRP